MLLNKNSKLNKRAGRGAKAFLGVILALAVFFTLIFVSVEACHECEDGECPICICLTECVRIVRGFFDSLPVLSALIICVSAVSLCSFAESKGLIFYTLISSKVRMNN